MISMKITGAKATSDFLKNQLQTVSDTSVSFAVKVPLQGNAERMFLGKNMKLIKIKGGFKLVPTNAKSPGKHSAKEIYQFFEYGDAENNPDPVSPALRRYTQRVIIPKIIKIMRQKIG